MNGRRFRKGIASLLYRGRFAVVVAAIAWSVPAAAQKVGNAAPQGNSYTPDTGRQQPEEKLSASASLYPEYVRYSLPAQAQQGDTCWDYSILGCLELELSRANKTTISLSGPYLAWAAARADQDAFDRKGSNFGRASRALERFGICERAQMPTADEDHPLNTAVSNETLRSATRLAKGLRIDWIRFWKSPPGLTDTEMLSVKRHLYAGHPVAVGMRWPKKLTVKDAGLCLLGTCRSLDETFDGHCVTLVGYEDNPRLPGGGAFIIRNTFGPNWMRNGFARLSYAYLRQFANDAISFSVDPDSPNSLSPELSPAHNTTDQSVLDLKAALCRPDPGLSITDDDIGRFKRGVWQSDNQVFCKATATNVGFTTELSAPETGRYALSIAGTKAPDYGIWCAVMDGKTVGTAYDFCWPNVEPTGEIRLGSVSLTQGKHTLRLECTGKSEASAGCFLGLDWIRLQRVVSSDNSR